MCGGGTGTSGREGLTRSLAMGALLLYPPAMALPVMRIERLGHVHGTTIWGGVMSLLESGHVLIGAVVLLCSVVVPIGKLVAMLVLSSPALTSLLVSDRQSAMLIVFVDVLGRWGMLDVLLVAVLVAAVKLGDFMSVAPGPGVAAFGAMVVLSLLASAAFEPRGVQPRWRSA